MRIMNLFLHLCRYRPWILWLWSAPSCTTWPATPTLPRSSPGVDRTPLVSHTRHLLHIDTQWACKGGAKWALVECSILNSRYVRKPKSVIFICASQCDSWISQPPNCCAEPDFISSFYFFFSGTFASYCEESLKPWHVQFQTQLKILVHNGFDALCV